MGRITFEPAITNPWWPWPDRRVYVVSSRDLPDGTPDDVIRVTGRPDALVERLRSDNIDGDVDSHPPLTFLRHVWSYR
jgi:dihydrofolate reductase